MRFVPFSAALICWWTASCACADVVTQWNFNSTVPDNNTSTGSAAPSLGTGTIANVGFVFRQWGVGSATDPAGADNSSLSLNQFPSGDAGDQTNGIQFNLSTAGYSNLVFSFELRHAANSSKYGAIQYALDGVSFTHHSYFGANAANAYFPRTVDLSLIAGAENNPNFAIRVVSAFEATATGSGLARYVTPAGASYSGGGAWQFDMATLAATAVPEASPIYLIGSVAGVAAVGYFYRSRRRR